MSKYYRCNPYLGSRYEISEKQALRKINSKWWTAVWDDYWQKFSNHAWYDMRDPERDWIFKYEEDDDNVKGTNREK